MRLSGQALLAVGITGAGMLAAEELTREKIDQMLKDLVAKPVQKEMPGASCYKPAPPAERMEYTCPLCKTKTLHEKEQVKHVRAADRYRRQMARVKELGLDAALDETDLCAKCRKDKASDARQFHIIIWRDDRAIRTRLEHTDLSVLIAFLEKKDVWTSDNGGKYPLQRELPRIREILGMGK